MLLLKGVRCGEEVRLEVSPTGQYKGFWMTEEPTRKKGKKTADQRRGGAAPASPSILHLLRRAPRQYTVRNQDDADNEKDEREKKRREGVKLFLNDQKNPSKNQLTEEGGIWCGKKSSGMRGRRASGGWGDEELKKPCKNGIGKRDFRFGIFPVEQEKRRTKEDHS